MLGSEVGMELQRSQEVDEVIADDPAEEEGEESVHEMLLEDVLGLDHIVLHSQELEDVQIAQQGAAQTEGDQSGQTH
jgi:hypothetical protein